MCSWESVFAEPMVAVPPSLGVNYVEASKPEIAVALPRHGKVLSFAQRLDNHGIGGIVWDCGAATAVLLDARPALVANRRVVDLGCGGSGIAGLAAAACGAASTTLTDIHELAALVEENIARNAASTRDGGGGGGGGGDDLQSETSHAATTESILRAVPRFVSYAWGAPTAATDAYELGRQGSGGHRTSGGAHAQSVHDEQRQQQQKQQQHGEEEEQEEQEVRGAPTPLLEVPFDTVLCADCMYDEASVTPLLLAVESVSGPGTLLLMSYKRRIDERERPFFERLAEKWDVEVVPRDCSAPLPPFSASSMPSASEERATEQAQVPMKLLNFTDLHLLLAVQRNDGASESSLEHWRRVISPAQPNKAGSESEFL